MAYCRYMSGVESLTTNNSVSWRDICCVDVVSSDTMVEDGCVLVAADKAGGLYVFATQRMMFECSTMYQSVEVVKMGRYCICKDK
jgi:hypothetical protein